MNLSPYQEVAALAKVKGIHCEWPFCRDLADLKAPDGKWYCDLHNAERVEALYRQAVGKRHKEKGTQRR